MRTFWITPFFFPGTLKDHSRNLFYPHDTQRVPE